MGMPSKWCYEQRRPIALSGGIPGSRLHQLIPLIPYFHSSTSLPPFSFIYLIIQFFTFLGLQRAHWSLALGELDS